MQSKSNADATMATEMVLELLTSSLPESHLRSKCEIELEEILLHEPSAFVQDLFGNLATGWP